MNKYKDITLLGREKVKYPQSPDEARLETFDNPNIKDDYVIRFSSGEVTHLCPRTSQPDFCYLIVDYCPDKLCVESKSLKLYFFSFRNHGSFHETLTNRIANDIDALLKPKWLRVVGLFNKRGGIPIDVSVIKGKLPENVNVLKLPKRMDGVF